jgi:hypothetical protein
VTAAVDASNGNWRATRRSLLAGAAGGAAGFAALRSLPWQHAPAPTLAGKGAADWINAVSEFGADSTGRTDSTTMIQAALASVPPSGGTVYLPAGKYLISSPLVVTRTGTSVTGAGQGATVLQVSPSFARAAAIAVTGANEVRLSGLAITGASPSYGSNPAADGIRIINSKSATVQDCYLAYLNGYAVGVVSDSASSSGSLWSRLVNVHVYDCAQGARILGNSASSYNTGTAVDSCIFEQIGGGDALLIEDAHDVLVSNLEAWNLSSSTGSSIHVKGASGAVQMSNIDVGGLTGTTPQRQATVLIESGPNGTPGGISINGGIVECGTPGLSVSAGNQITVSGIQFFKNANHGLTVSGTADILVTGCYFSHNGYTAAADNFDAAITASSGAVRIESCKFSTPAGSGSGQVACAINANPQTYVQQCWFTGASAFGGGGGSHPKLARNNPGFNPVGHVTSPPIPASGTSLTNPFGQDCTVCVTGGTVSAVSIGGTATGLKSGAFRLPWNQTITLAYSRAPTWTWFCE